MYHIYVYMEYIERSLSDQLSLQSNKCVDPLFGRVSFFTPLLFVTVCVSVCRRAG